MYLPFYLEIRTLFPMLTQTKTDITYVPYSNSKSGGGGGKIFSKKQKRDDNIDDFAQYDNKRGVNIQKLSCFIPNPMKIIIIAAE